MKNRILYTILFLLIIGCQKSDISVSSILLTPDSLNMKVGETKSLSITVLPKEAENTEISVTSNNTSVAKITNNIVEAISPGTAIITATASDNGKTATCKVTVSDIEVEKVTLDKSSLSLIEEQSEQLTAIIAPENATNKTIKWSSSDNSVASVSENGLVSAIKAGNATITAKAGNQTATCNVTIKAKVIEVTKVTLNKKSLSLIEEQSEQLTATIAPENATDKTIKWSSSDNSVASVSENGLVTAIKAGNATITAKAGNQTATCNVTIKKKPNGDIEDTHEEDIF